MAIEEIAIGFLTNFLYDSAKKISQTFQDTYSHVYDDSIKELVPRYPEFREIFILILFLHESSVENLIKAYFAYPEIKDKSFYEDLSIEFTNFFAEELFF